MTPPRIECHGEDCAREYRCPPCPGAAYVAVRKEVYEKIQQITALAEGREFVAVKASELDELVEAADELLMAQDLDFRYVVPAHLGKKLNAALQPFRRGEKG